MQYVGHIYCIIFPLLCNRGSSLNNTNSLTPSSVGRNSAHVTQVGPLPRVSQVAIKVLVRLHSFPQALGCIRSSSFESRSSVPCGCKMENLVSSLVVSSGVWSAPCCCLVAPLCPTPCDPMSCAPQTFLPSTVSWSFLKLMSTESRMPSNHPILCLPLLLPTSIFPSIRVFSSEPALPITWPKYWSFSFSISPSSEYSGLISLRMGWALQAIKKTVVCILGEKGRLWKFLSRGLPWSASSIKWSLQLLCGGHDVCPELPDRVWDTWSLLCTESIHRELQSWGDMARQCVEQQELGL